MKRSFIFLVALCVMAVSSVMAQTSSGSCGTNLTWRFNNGSLTISGSGAMEDYESSGSAPWFHLASQITKVYIGDEVTYVGENAFGGGYKLDLAEFGLSVERIHQDAFRSIKKLDEVVWGTNAYENNFSSNMGPFAYYGGDVIKTFTVLDEVTYLPTFLCYGMYNLTTLTLGDSVESIGAGCFGLCSALQSIDLRNVTEINILAFENCVKLDNITFPRSIKFISSQAFTGCTSLHSITWGVDHYTGYDTGGPFYYLSDQITSFTFADNVTEIPQYLCNGMKCFTALTLPEGIRVIGRNAFAECRTISSVTLPSSLIKIDRGAFSGCTSLRRITTLACTPPILQSGVFEDCMPHLSDITLNVPDCSTYTYRIDEGWKEFTIEGGTEETGASAGALKGRFSVSADKQVFFSQGNLQYQPYSERWRFAENQYDIAGKDNANISDNANVSSSYTGWIDLFGWGTSGYNNKQPYMTSEDSEEYGDGWNDIAGTDYDWGIYNPIVNGGNQAGIWYTMTSAEWEYLLNRRPNAAYLRAPATVMGMKGFMLMPDGWVKPESYQYNPDATDFITNTYNERFDAWKKMEKEGAVFLPAAGGRCGTHVGLVGETGDYWTSSATQDSEIEVEEVYFTTTDAESFTVSYSERYYGLSVRLVCNTEKLQGIDQVQRDLVPSTKVLRNGQLIIRHGGKEYNALGEMIK